jgi:hypothetical protein
MKYFPRPSLAIAEELRLGFVGRHRMKIHFEINQAFRLRGINLAGDQRGCSPPLETPFDGARSKLRGLLKSTKQIADEFS